MLIKSCQIAALFLGTGVLNNNYLDYELNESRKLGLKLVAFSESDKMRSLPGPWRNKGVSMKLMTELGIKRALKIDLWK
ncbi:MAG: hypothetical protein ACFFDT_32375 [Candidatus Hodarchaeota archaeon]